MNNILNDQFYMAQALRLAEKGLYTTKKNPRVGCVIVKNNNVIGEGFHACAGEPHAEINALNNSREDVEDATVYITLEPCSHHGKTPPCSDALVSAKVKKVVAAMLDPNPIVNGKGIQFLESNNIDTQTNILSSEARLLNKGFIQRVTNHRPYITVKSAMSVDGKTALRSGESKWISSEASRKDAHKLRARSCVILTGIETVITDNPKLNVRLSNDELGLESEFTQPTVVVLDTKLRLPKNANILQTKAKVIIYTCSNDKTKHTELNSTNVEVVCVNQRNNFVDLDNVMADLANREINEVLVEAGSTLVGNLLENKLVDEMIVYIAPTIMGNLSRGLATIPEITKMQDSVSLELHSYRKIGSDLKMTYIPKYEK